MTAAWLWARSRLRRRWRSLVLISLVAGLGAGVCLTAATGAKRAATGWDRFRAATRSPNALFSPPPDADPARFRTVQALPDVTAAARFTYTPVAPAPMVPGQDGGAFIGLDPAFGRSVYVPRILAGRHTRPGRIDEVTVNRPMADALGIEAGERVRLRSGFDPGDLRDLGQATVVGIHTGQFDVGANGGQPSMLLGSAFLAAHRDALILGEPAGLVRLTAGDAGAAAFGRGLREIYGAGAVVVPADQEEESVVDAVNVQAVGLGLLALAAGLATVVASVQALGRLLRAEQADLLVLRSLGMGRRQVAMGGASIGAVVGGAVAAIALGIGVMASAQVPTGTAARLEPPGLRPEPVVLAAGGLVLLGLLVGAGAIVALRTVARRSEDGRTRPAVGAGPLPVRLGTAWALARPGSGPAGASARAALVAAGVGLAGIAAVVTFATSLDHLVDTGRLHGWAFDGALVTEDMDRAGLATAMAGLTRDPRVEGLAWVSVVDAPVDGVALELWALDAARGAVHPSLITGRAPVGSDEVALGSETMSDLGVAVGDQVRIGSEGGAPFRVVGRAVYPELGNNSDLANAGSITVGGLGRLVDEPVMAMALVRMRSGVAVGDVFEDNAQDGVESVPPFLPPRIRNVEAIGNLPWLMAGFLAVLVLIAVGHALILSVGGRRRDLAVLRALGAVRRQVAAAVWSQASLTVLAGALVGVPAGIAIGRQTWALVAHGLGVLDRPVVGWALLGAVGVGALAVANLMATGPAIVASRLRPARALRSE